MFSLVLDDGLISGAKSFVGDFESLLTKESLKSIPAIMAYPGFFTSRIPAQSGVGRIVNLSVSTVLGEIANKVHAVSPAEAMRLGADAVSVHVSLGVPGEGRMLAQLSNVAEECHLMGLPVVAASYARDKVGLPIQDSKLQAHAARAAMELGADIVKVAWDPTFGPLEDIVAAVAPIPIVIAGGTPSKQIDTLELMRSARRAGAQGAFVGRRILSSRHPRELMRRVVKVWGASEPE